MLRRRPANRPTVKNNRPRVFTLMIVSSHGRTRTASVSLRMVVSVGCILALVALTCLFSSAGYVTALRRIAELRHLETFRENVGNQITDLQTEFETLSKEIEDAQEEVRRVREILRSEGIFDSGSASKTSVWRAAESPTPLSRGGAWRPTSTEQMALAVKQLEIESDSLLTLVAGLKEDTAEVLGEASAEVAYRRAIPCTYPVKAGITSSFGWRRHPVSGVSAFHSGIDIGAPVGTAVRATADGVVTAAGWDGGYGLRIVIDHGYEIETLYGHCSKLEAKVGQKIKRGDIVARVGDTGVSTGPHVHYEVRLKGEPVDPVSYLPD
ncbi:MAG: M23 family metallopeptidase [Bacillota bacterium]